MGDFHMWIYQRVKDGADYFYIILKWRCFMIILVICCHLYVFNDVWYVADLGEVSACNPISLQKDTYRSGMASFNMLPMLKSQANWKNQVCSQKTYQTNHPITLVYIQHRWPICPIFHVFPYPQWLVWEETRSCKNDSKIDTKSIRYI